MKPGSNVKHSVRREMMKTGWDEVAEALREMGQDPDRVLAEAGETVTYYHDHPAQIDGDDWPEDDS